jgi:hypothetical protein
MSTLKLDAEVRLDLANGGHVVTRWMVDGLPLFDIGEALDLLIKDLQQERRGLPATHTKPVALSDGAKLAERMRNLVRTMAGSTTPQCYLTGALDLADEIARTFAAKESAA